MTERIRSQVQVFEMRFLRHVSRMPQERFPKQALLAKVKGKRPVGQPGTRWSDYIEDLGWNCLGLQPSEILTVVADRDVWRLNLELLPPQPSQTRAGTERKRSQESKTQQSDPAAHIILGLKLVLEIPALQVQSQFMTILQYCVKWQYRSSGPRKTKKTVRQNQGSQKEKGNLVQSH